MKMIDDYWLNDYLLSDVGKYDAIEYPFFYFYNNEMNNVQSLIKIIEKQYNIVQSEVNIDKERYIEHYYNKFIRQVVWGLSKNILGPLPIKFNGVRYSLVFDDFFDPDSFVHDRKYLRTRCNIFMDSLIKGLGDYVVLEVGQCTLIGNCFYRYDVSKFNFVINVDVLYVNVDMDIYNYLYKHAMIVDKKNNSARISRTIKEYIDPLLLEFATGIPTEEIPTGLVYEYVKELIHRYDMCNLLGIDSTDVRKQLEKELPFYRDENGGFYNRYSNISENFYTRYEDYEKFSYKDIRLKIDVDDMQEKGWSPNEVIEYIEQHKEIYLNHEKRSLAPGSKIYIEELLNKIENKEYDFDVMIDKSKYNLELSKNDLIKAVGYVEKALRYMIDEDIARPLRVNSICRYLNINTNSTMGKIQCELGLVQSLIMSTAEKIRYGVGYFYFKCEQLDADNINKSNCSSKNFLRQVIKSM